MTTLIDFQLPDVVIEQVAERVADLIARQLSPIAASPWLTIDEAAQYLGCSRQRLYKRKDIPHHKHGNRLMYHRAEIDGYLANSC
jgi:excisionase family DNA binding protein